MNTPTFSFRPTLLALFAACLGVSSCNTNKERALALISISQCDESGPVLSELMRDVHSPSRQASTKTHMARDVAEICSSGAEQLRKHYPGHACIPFMESSAQMAEIAYGSYTGGRPMTSADLSQSRLAQNRAACVASGAPYVE